MLTSQKLELRRSEIRQQMNELNAKDTLDKEELKQLNEWTKELGSLEVRYRAALTAEDAEERQAAAEHPDPEMRELAGLQERSQVSSYIAAALEQRAVGGAELEYNQAIGIAGNRFPLSLLAPPEERATTDTDTTMTPRSWLDRLLAESAASQVGITMESVPEGQPTYPITTAGATGAQRAREQDAAVTAWTIGVEDLTPKRNAVHLEFTMEDAARLPGLESALRRDLQAGLMESIDRAIFLGDSGATGTGADIVGLNTAAITEVTLTQANKVKGPETLAVFAGLIDGIHATSMAQLMVVASVGANQLWLSTIVNSAAENQTLYQFLMASGLMHSTRANIATATTNNTMAAFIGRGRGIQGAAVAAMWASGELIRDPYTKAKSGEVLLTMNYLWDFGVIRASNFARLKYVT